jgi:hypothetical protein
VGTVWVVRSLLMQGVIARGGYEGGYSVGSTGIADARCDYKGWMQGWVLES